MVAISKYIFLTDLAYCYDWITGALQIMFSGVHASTENGIIDLEID